MTDATKADLEAILRIHEPIQGEARADPCSYCKTCHTADGSHSRWPCRTMRLVQGIFAREALEQQ